MKLYCTADLLYITSPPQKSHIQNLHRAFHFNQGYCISYCILLQHLSLIFVKQTGAFLKKIKNQKKTNKVDINLLTKHIQLIKDFEKIIPEEEKKYYV